MSLAFILEIIAKFKTQLFIAALAIITIGYVGYLKHEVTSLKDQNAIIEAENKKLHLSLSNMTAAVTEQKQSFEQLAAASQSIRESMLVLNTTVSNQSTTVNQRLKNILNKPTAQLSCADAIQLLRQYPKETK